jgi:FixJ family two-component response regulator
MQGVERDMAADDETVYVVDNDPSVCSSLARLLRSKGLRVQSFTSAEDFLRNAGRHRTECLVLDTRVPGLSGFELQQWLATTDETLPIIFISDHADAPAVLQAMKLRAVDFLAKPFDGQEIVDAVRLSLKQCREARALGADQREIQTRVATLTPRERQVLSLVVAGRLNKQIAGELGITEQTVKVHRARGLKKMRVLSLAELVRVWPDPLQAGRKVETH